MLCLSASTLPTFAVRVPPNCFTQPRSSKGCLGWWLNFYSLIMDTNIHMSMVTSLLLTPGSGLAQLTKSTPTEVLQSRVGRAEGRSAAPCRPPKCFHSGCAFYFRASFLSLGVWSVTYSPRMHLEGSHVRSSFTLTQGTPRCRISRGVATCWRVTRLLTSHSWAWAADCVAASWLGKAWRYVFHGVAEARIIETDAVLSVYASATLIKANGHAPCTTVSTGPGCGKIGPLATPGEHRPPPGPFFLVFYTKGIQSLVAPTIGSNQAATPGE